MRACADVCTCMSICTQNAQCAYTPAHLQRLRGCMHASMRTHAHICTQKRKTNNSHVTRRHPQLGTSKQKTNSTVTPKKAHATYINAYIHTYIHTRTRACAHTHKHTQTHTDTHRHTQTHTDTHTTYIHIHTRHQGSSIGRQSRQKQTPLSTAGPSAALPL